MYILISIIMLACGCGTIDLTFLLSGVIYIIIGIIEIAIKSVDVKGGVITIVIGAVLAIISHFSDLTELLVGFILLLSAVPVLFGAGFSIALGISGVDTGDATINNLIAAVLLIVGVLLIISMTEFHFGDSTVDILIGVGGIVLLAIGTVNLIKVSNIETHLPTSWRTSFSYSDMWQQNVFHYHDDRTKHTLIHPATTNAKG